MIYNQTSASQNQKWTIQLEERRTWDTQDQEK
jgi:hypothetical protein